MQVKAKFIRMPSIAASSVSVYGSACKGNDILSKIYNKTQRNNKNFIFSNDMVCERIGTILNC